MKAVAVVLASGSGHRFGANKVPKHLTPILGVPILVWTLNTAINSSIFSSVIVVTRKDDLSDTESVLSEYFNKDEFPILLTEGGNERTESFSLGFQNLVNANLVDSESIVALFDANRPFTPESQLRALYEVALDGECSVPARPVVNGVAKAESGRILEVPIKSSFVEFVTPEFLRLNAFNFESKSFMKGYNCFVEFALALGFQPLTVKANELNAKLTYPEDKTYIEGVALDNKLITPSKLNI